jgi:hypothetical protein
MSCIFELNACSCLYAHKWFLYGSVCLCFDLETRDTCLYLYDHNRSMYRMSRFRIRVCSLENCPIYLARAMPWFNFPKALLSGSFLALQSRSESLERTTMIVNPRVYFTLTTEFIARRIRKTFTQVTKPRDNLPKNPLKDLSELYCPSTLTFA